MRLLHFADLHLGVENYGRLDPASGLHTRFLDFLRCLEFVVERALIEKVDAVLFAGDVYHNAHPNPTWQREFARLLRQLQLAHIPTVITVGNHDMPAAFGRATSVDVFGALDLEDTYVIRTPCLVQVKTRAGLLQVAGLPWPTRHFIRSHDEFRSLDQEAVNLKIREICRSRIEHFGREVDPGHPAVLLAHTTASEAMFSGSERPAIVGLDPTLLTSTLAHPAFDYVALGHIHRHQVLNPGGSPPVVYAGSIERIDFGEKDDTKGFCLVDIADIPRAGERERKRRAEVAFVPTPARRFVTIAADARNGDPTAALLKAIEEADIEGAIVKLSYLCAPDSIRSLDLNAVRRALLPAHNIAGIVPQSAPAAKTRRSAISEDAQLLDALERFIDNDPSLCERREVLKKVALELEHELEAGVRG